MITHTDFWDAIDTFCTANKINIHDLKATADVEPTTITRERFWDNGNPRWISTKTLAKMLNLVNADMHDFALCFPPKPKQPKEDDHATDRPSQN